MAIDKQAGGAPTDLKSGMQQFVAQSWNQYNDASAAYKANPTPENAQRQIDALLAAVDAQVKQAVADGNVEGASILAKLGPEITKILKEARAKVRITAADKNVVLQTELFRTQRNLLEKQAKDMFDLSMSGQKTTVSLLGLVKGLAAVFKLFGYDTTDLMKACDDGIRDAKIAAGGIDYAALGKAGLVIDTRSAEAQVEGGVDDIVPSIGRTSRVNVEAANGLIKGYQGDAHSPKSKAPQAGSAAIVVPTDVAIAVIRSNARTAGIKDPDKLIQAVRKIAKSDDGDEISLTHKEMIQLNGALVTATGNRDTADKLTAKIKSNKAVPAVVQADGPAAPHPL